ncbi:hypothetical protein AAHE18_03G148300 [Arachis hypogaea]
MDTPEVPIEWYLYVDGSSNKMESGAGVIIESNQGTQIELSLKFGFPASNNQAEYDALLAGLKMAREVGAQKLIIFSDSQNAWADALSKLASTKPGGNNRSLIQEILQKPSISEEEKVLAITGRDQGWMTPIINYLTTEALPTDEKEGNKLKWEAQYYTIINNTLYKREISTPMLKCVPTYNTKDILEEVHSGICGNHLGAQALAKKVLRAGFYWPTLQKEATDFVRTYSPCQKHANFHTVSPEELISIEAEPLANATTQRSRKFLYRNIVTRFGVPYSITIDNGTQFTDAGFRKLAADLNIKQQFTSVEHPQANGQAEAANKVILAGIKRRLQDAKGAWAEELPQVLWAYRTTPHSTTRESPFRLAYRMEAMIPVEVEERSPRVIYYSEKANPQLQMEELELLPEVRERARIRE